MENKARREGLEPPESRGLEGRRAVGRAALLSPDSCRADSQQRAGEAGLLRIWSGREKRQILSRERAVP